MRGENELPFRFGEDALADEMAGGHAGRAFDVIVEPINGHAELLRVKSELVLAAKEFVDQRPQRRDGGIGRLQSHAAGACAAGGETRHSDGDQRQETAHGHTITFAAKASLLEEFCAQP